MSADAVQSIAIGPAARRWWSSLQDFIDGRPNRGRDRAALARLRRAASPLDAIDEPAVFRLGGQLGLADNPRLLESRLSRIAVIAAVLAHVRSDAAPDAHDRRRRFAAMLGKSEKDRPPPMSPLRFKRLLASQDDGDILIQFRRAVALAGNKGINVADLAESIFHWNSDRLRMRWAFDYYGAGFAAPRASDPSDNDEDDAP